jgi:hypothetical protein
MSKKFSHENIGDSNETTDVSLAALTTQLNAFVGEGTLDS